MIRIYFTINDGKRTVSEASQGHDGGLIMVAAGGIDAWVPTIPETHQAVALTPCHMPVPNPTLIKRVGPGWKQLCQCTVWLLGLCSQDSAQQM